MLFYKIESRPGRERQLQRMRITMEQVNLLRLNKQLILSVLIHSVKDTDNEHYTTCWTVAFILSAPFLQFLQWEI